MNLLETCICTQNGILESKVFLSTKAPLVFSKKFLWSFRRPGSTFEGSGLGTRSLWASWNDGWSGLFFVSSQSPPRCLTINYKNVFFNVISCDSFSHGRFLALKLLPDNIFRNDFFKTTSTHPKTFKNEVDLAKTHLWGSPTPLKNKQNHQNPGYS